jgi:hypothetical protein
VKAAVWVSESQKNLAKAGFLRSVSHLLFGRRETLRTQCGRATHNPSFGTNEFGFQEPTQVGENGDTIAACGSPDDTLSRASHSLENKMKIEIIHCPM